MNPVNTHHIPDKGLPLRTGLWLAQLLLAGVYLPTGIAAIFLPMEQVLAIVPWAGHMPEELLRFIGGVDLAAGLGLLLPSVTRILPGLTVLAAVCSAWLQGFAILLHVPFDVLPTPLPISLTLFALSVFVAWGRSGQASVAPRWRDRSMAVIDAFVSEQVDGSEGRSNARRRVRVRAGESRGNEVFCIQRGLRGAPFIARKRESEGNKAA